jgi:hypothetical protein
MRRPKKAQPRRTRRGTDVPRPRWDQGLSNLVESPLEQVRIVFQVVADLVPGDDRHREAGVRDLPRRLLAVDIALGGRGDDEPGELRLECPRLLDLLLDHLRRQAVFETLALHAGPLRATLRPAEDIHSGLRLALPSVLLGIWVVPEPAPEIEAEILEVLPVAQEREDEGAGHSGRV